ncbi:MAG: hypothetical protein P4K83_06820 [Terracidiphilus sp.]|nr:hypothetical protein [Terracidiphilus sp.]
MAQIPIRKLDLQVKMRLQELRRYRRLEEEGRKILRVAVNEQESAQFGGGPEAVALFSGQGAGL